MRIIILTHNSERHYYFCNKIIENSNKVVGVITGGKYYQKNKVDRLKELIIKKRFLKAIKNKLLNIYYKKFHTRLIKEKNSVEEKFFGGSKSIFNKQHKHLLISSYNNKYKSINDDYFVSLIREKNPDVILVMGTCLLDEKILSSAKHVINLHTGLSPYYRGAWTNLIPFIDDNYGYFGVTIHKLSLGIDSGDIIYSACPEINSSDNYSTINSKSIIIGTKLMIRSLELLAKNNLNAIKQWQKGRIVLTMDFNSFIAYKYFKNKHNFIKNYIALINNNELTAPTMVENGMLLN